MRWDEKNVLCVLFKSKYSCTLTQVTIWLSNIHFYWSNIWPGVSVSNGVLKNNDVAVNSGPLTSRDNRSLVAVKHRHEVKAMCQCVKKGNKELEREKFKPWWLFFPTSEQLACGTGSECQTFGFWNVNWNCPPMPPLRFRHQTGVAEVSDAPEPPPHFC